jgi:hypothetical protein
MEEETATLETAPVETPSGDDALAAFLAEDDAPQGDPEADGQSPEGEPALEEEAQQAASQSEEAPPVFKVKVRGEEVDVPLPELLNGYSRTADYKAKTAEVAELRRQTETEYADKLEQQVRQFVALDPVLAQTKDVDWNALAQADPTLYVQIKAQHDARVELIESAAAEIDQIRQQEAQREAESLKEAQAAETAALLKALPELSDPAELTKFATGVVDYLRKSGVPDDVISGTDDHRALIIADKARKWDALQAAKVTVEAKKVAPANQPTLKPRAADNPRAPKRPAPNASDADKHAWVMGQLEAE